MAQRGDSKSFQIHPVFLKLAMNFWSNFGRFAKCTLSIDTILWHVNRAIPSARFTLDLPEEKKHSIGPVGDGAKIPYDTWERMTDQGKHICRHIVAEPGVCYAGDHFFRR